MDGSILFWDEIVNFGPGGVSFGAWPAEPAPNSIVEHIYVTVGNVDTDLSFRDRIVDFLPEQLESLRAMILVSTRLSEIIIEFGNKDVRSDLDFLTVDGIHALASTILEARAERLRNNPQAKKIALSLQIYVHDAQDFEEFYLESTHRAALLNCCVDHFAAYLCRVEFFLSHIDSSFTDFLESSHWETLSCLCELSICASTMRPSFQPEQMVDFVEKQTSVSDFKFSIVSEDCYVSKMSLDKETLTNCPTGRGLEVYRLLAAILLKEKAKRLAGKVVAGKLPSVAAMSMVLSHDGWEDVAFNKIAPSWNRFCVGLALASQATPEIADDDAAAGLVERAEGAPVSKSDLEDIAGRCKAVMQKIDVFTKRIENISDMNAAKEDIMGVLKDMSKAQCDLANIVLGKGYADNALMNQQTNQVPTASREQHVSGNVEKRSETDSGNVSPIHKRARLGGKNNNNNNNNNK